MRVGILRETKAGAKIVASPEEVIGAAKGSVVIYGAVDQGGCVETIHPTSHDDPTFSVDGVIHYGVTNMPGAVPYSSTLALANAILPYLLELCDRGVDETLRRQPPLAREVNCYRGEVTISGVADTIRLPVAHAPWA